MGKFIIRGGQKLNGKIKISGSKNAALPIMAASVLIPGKVRLKNVPCLTDVEVMIKALTSLGAEVHRQADVVDIDTSGISSCEVHENLTRQMRGSNLLMGALLGRFKNARVAAPGGCAIGVRPLDIHLKALEQLGYQITFKQGFMEGNSVRSPESEIVFDFPSVGATENVIMAAALIAEPVIIHNVAREPEIVDLQNFLNAMGADIRGAGQSSIYINKCQELFEGEYRIMPDRIEAGTFMIAAAITGGDVTVEGVVPEHLTSLSSKLEAIGAKVTVEDEAVRVVGAESYVGTDIKTMPYPGFPTDLQAQIMALLAKAQGTSMLVENIFENRFMHVDELRRMGAEIKIEGKVAIVSGSTVYNGAIVEATDLRAGAALILAGLAAQGQTEVRNAHYVERGYENIQNKLQLLGADIIKAD